MGILRQFHESKITKNRQNGEFMPRFFVQLDKIDLEHKTVLIEGEDAHHISRSLRMAKGERITVCDMQGIEYDCEIRDFCDDSSVTAEIISRLDCSSEPPYKVILYQGLPKGDKLDSVIQKSVECGVFALQPFESSRCIAKEKSDSGDKKLIRRNKIALEAAKQSGRGIVPRILPTVSFKEAVDRASEADIPLFCYEDEHTVSLKNALCSRRDLFSRDRQPTLSVVIGSEGGFSPQEAEYAREHGMLTVGLGPRILRTETAPAFVLGCLAYELEMDEQEN